MHSFASVMARKGQEQISDEPVVYAVRVSKPMFDTRHCCCYNHISLNNRYSSIYIKKNDTKYPVHINTKRIICTAVSYDTLQMRYIQSTSEKEERKNEK